MTLTIQKEDVFEEVAKTTAYIGAKDENTESYDVVSTTKANNDLLDRFWNESCSAATEKFKRFVSEIHTTDESYAATLETGYRYNEALTDSISVSLGSFFVAMIVSKWMAICKRAEEAASYSNDATGAMDDVMRKLYHRAAPKRVITTNADGGTIGNSGEE